MHNDFYKPSIISKSLLQDQNVLYDKDMSVIFIFPEKQLK